MGFTVTVCRLHKRGPATGLARFKWLDDIPAEPATDPPANEQGSGKTGTTILAFLCKGDRDAIDILQAIVHVHRIKELRHKLSPGGQSQPGKVSYHRVVGVIDEGSVVGDGVGIVTQPGT